MAILPKDIKLLWSLAAGRCSYPGCFKNCVVFLNKTDPTLIGEMAHVIAKKPSGARGVPSGGTDTYDNLILLCPTHHKIIDKAPIGTYPEEMLLSWKKEHEKTIEEAIKKASSKNKYRTRKEMAFAIKRLLVKNARIWKQLSPDSEIALNDPLSNNAFYWDLMKIIYIIPNNRNIVDIINKNEELIDLDDFEIFQDFILHANLFEKNCFIIIDNPMRFPTKFTEVINRYAEK